MAVFKCKMCGGDLEVTEGMKVVECDFCGTTQTVPTVKDENIQSLFNRANTLRMKSEFDKAEAIYEKIVQAKEDECEAYWGIILCRYGIEYVEDPKTFKRIPTCHRTSYDSVIADEDYKSAIKYADLVQRIVYENEAKEIDRIQREILELSQKEEPYDVFICYKETDSAGRRTVDSAIANDIYYQLTQEGYKVFYAAITLEDKLGSAYEPCIFAALNSAKVMLAIGTKPEYFNAVWVKNEWSRYLRLMKNDRTKLLIPCYKDMDAYELPDEFAHLQAQDMGKIGFINDIVRGIKKVIVKDEQKAPAFTAAAVASAPAGNAAPLLKRAFIFLEDEEWESADEYFEKVLDMDPECAEAYLGKLCVELEVTDIDELSNINDDFENRANFKKAIRFATGEAKKKIDAIIENKKNRIEEEKRKKEEQLAEKKRLEQEKKKKEKYLFLIDNVETSTNFDSLENLYHRLLALGDYLDAPKYAEECRIKMEEYEVIDRIWKEYSEAYAEYNSARKALDNVKEKFCSVESNLTIWISEFETVSDARNKLLDIDKEITETYNRIVFLAKEKENLGVFAFSKKKEISDEIERLEAKRQRLECDRKKYNSIVTCSKTEEEFREKIKTAEESKQSVENEQAFLQEKEKEFKNSFDIVTEKVLDKNVLIKLFNYQNAGDVLLLNERIKEYISNDEELSGQINTNMDYVDAVSDIEEIYFEACALLSNTRISNSAELALEKFMSIKGYKDSKLKIEECKKKLGKNTVKSINKSNTHKSITNEKRCPYCGFSLDNKVEKLLDLYLEGEDVKCPECGRLFDDDIMMKILD
ncbi:MAG: TIR domain-containing protein [Oscillospiraceae bacterium]|nr:TIR domain-containing protein [Oscillospiraceae bacterium]